MLTFLMGITLAMGVIALFENYREGVVGAVEEDEAIVALSNVDNSVFSLKNSDSGHVEAELPEDVGGYDYSTDISEEFRLVTVTGREYSRSNQHKGSFSGTTDHKEINVRKTGEEFVLRGN